MKYVCDGSLMSRQRFLIPFVTQIWCKVEPFLTTTLRHQDLNGHHRKSQIWFQRPLEISAGVAFFGDQIRKLETAQKPPYCQ